MKVLLFSPHAYFTVHALPEALVAESLLSKGHEVVTINCNGLYGKQCLCMPLTVINDEKSKQLICKTCKINRDAINKEFGFRALMLENYLTVDDKVFVENLVNNLELEKYLELTIQNIPIAQYALYEVFLNFKLSSAVLPVQLWDPYKIKLTNCLLTLYAIGRIIEIERPDRITTYNSTYSVNRIVCAVAEQREIPHFELISGNGNINRYQKILINKGIGKWITINQHPYLQEKRKIPLSKTEINNVTLNYEALFKAKSPWVYSVASQKKSSAKLRSQLGVTPGQKLLLATMSSADEVVGLSLAGVDTYANQSVFSSQLEWIEWLTVFARSNPRYFIVIRVHPREFPNKRDKIMSENAIKFINFFKKLDKAQNVFVNTPTDDISLYDLLKITDVLLNRSSTAGLEASLFGVPVVGTGDKLFLFDQKIQTESYSEKEYVSNIAKAVDTGWRFENVVLAYRWLNYILSEVEIDISDGYKLKTPYVYRVMNLIVRVMSKMSLPVSNITPIWHVKGRGKPLKYADRLIYAIVNDKETHIGQFMQDNDVVDELTESQQIREQYKKLMMSISAKDIDFMKRIENCVK